MDIIRTFFRIVLILCLPIAVAGVTYFFLTKALLGPANGLDTRNQIVEIAPGMSFGQIAKDIADRGLVKYRWSLEILARFKKTDTRIKAGEYEFSPAMTPKEILAKLIAGDMLQRQIVLKEGETIWELGALVEKAGLLSKAEFDTHLADQTLLAKAGIESRTFENYNTTFEGYLFPETYFFSRPVTPQQIIWKMLEEGDKHWPIQFSDRADELRLTRAEVLTLASIIEKESGNQEEQPLISSVFHNRLAQGMKLQSDPTVIYGIKNFNGNLTREDLLRPNPYNTYLNFGLPPGPICNPGATSLQAALYPAESPFLYFVSDGNGSHIFSATLAEHNAAVAKFQKHLPDAGATGSAVAK